MSENRKRITIKDIAKISGISAGTVDRVLHNRGDVSERSKAKIKAVIKELNYEPNIIASSLSARKTYRFITLLPSFEQGGYWEEIDKGIDKAQEDYAMFNVAIEKRYFNQFDAQSFFNAVDDLEKESFDGLLMSPILREKSITLCEKMNKLNIPVVFVDSLIEEAKIVAYFGQPSYQSGYIGAQAASQQLPAGKSIALFRALRKGFIGANQTLQRMDGFLSYMREFRPDCSVINVELPLSTPDNISESNDIMRQAFDKKNNVGVAVIFNSTAYRIASFLDSEAIKDIQVVGYDTLTSNVYYLKKGIISMLIGQRPNKQSHHGIKALFNNVVMKQPVKRKNYMPIDILVKDNIDYYVNYEED